MRQSERDVPGLCVFFFVKYTAPAPEHQQCNQSIETQTGDDVASHSRRTSSKAIHRTESFSLSLSSPLLSEERWETRTRNKKMFAILIQSVHASFNPQPHTHTHTHSLEYALKIDFAEKNNTNGSGNKEHPIEADNG